MGYTAEMRTVFRGATLLRCDALPIRPMRGDLAVVGGMITAVGEVPAEAGDVVVDVRGRWLVPGFVQPHIHLVQTLFRGLADDLALMDWLQSRIWPLERAHDIDSVYASARLGIHELLTGGTTALLDMATVSHTDAVFQAAQEAGIRMWCGSAMMDRDNLAGLGTTTDVAMRTANDLADRWHRPDGLLRYAYAPRFVPSCSDELLTAVASEARARGCLLHTHASENRDEVALVRQLTGRDNIHHLHEQGLSGADVVLAHCIHLSQSEMELLALTRTRVAHCPSSNQKLASGLCSVPELLSRGIHVSLAADGAPCNNRLDAFAEMRLAALLQSTRLGAGALPAPIVLRMATASGAEALGFPGGVLAVGKVADLVVLDPDMIWSGGDPASTVVYTMDSRSVRQTWVHGRKVAEDGRVLAWDNAETAALCHASLGRVRARAGL